jgi:uncharacterized protein (TIGR03118 family)
LHWWRWRPAEIRQAHFKQRYRPVLEPLEERSLLSGGFLLTRLTSDIPGFAATTDPNLVNPWGIALNSTDPFWVADGGSGVSTLLDGQGRVPPLVVRIASPGNSTASPTGTVFNDGPGFVISENGLTGPSQFLFATEDGTIEGWSAGVDVTHAVVVVDNSSNPDTASGAVYKGLALAANTRGTLLYAANFRAGTVDVFDQKFAPVQLSGSFSDPAIPDGFAPFNVQNIGGRLFVTYAKQDAHWYEDVPGPGNGFIDVFDTNGHLLSRFASGGPLNSPWGLALAPANFGTLSGDVLVGNTGDGRINAFDARTGAFVGQMTDAAGIPIRLDHLWGLAFGNGGGAGSQQALYFTAGIDNEQHGLFGKLMPDGPGPAVGRGPAANTGDADGTIDTQGFSNYLRAVLGKSDAYPLPPESGPALRTDISAQPTPSVVLLPVTESSFVVAPALLTVSEHDVGQGFSDGMSPKSPTSPGDGAATFARGALTAAVSGIRWGSSGVDAGMHAGNQLHHPRISGALFDLDAPSATYSTTTASERHVDGDAFVHNRDYSSLGGSDVVTFAMTSAESDETWIAAALAANVTGVAAASSAMDGAAHVGASERSIAENQGTINRLHDWSVAFTTLILVSCFHVAWSSLQRGLSEGSGEEAAPLRSFSF